MMILKGIDKMQTQASPRHSLTTMNFVAPATVIIFLSASDLMILPSELHLVFVSHLKRK
jgi:hypothetical protein